MFENFKFTQRQIENYFKAAVRDLGIACRTDIPEVIFKFSYDGLLKLVIAICAHNGLRVKSRKGHHIELIKKLSILLNNPDIKTIGDGMRSKRNFDLYGGGILISRKEANEYFEWIKNIFDKAEQCLKKNPKIPI